MKGSKPFTTKVSLQGSPRSKQVQNYTKVDDPLRGLGSDATMQSLRSTKSKNSLHAKPQQQVVQQQIMQPQGDMSQHPNSTTNKKMNQRFTQ